MVIDYAGSAAVSRMTRIRCRYRAVSCTSKLLNAKSAVRKE